ncbi:GspE/PulE family protein [Marinobacterium jannaschii]|uniref:GspE/PulE family protein n=1 Tax=Marinobacterium jannaschii TaxID=64970 RepID=UPI0004819A59|nr:ATPase, T2SS/T4P/T4SS family [Marinobacterium jannaschii]
MNTMTAVTGAQAGPHNKSIIPDHKTAHRTLGEELPALLSVHGDMAFLELQDGSIIVLSSVEIERSARLPVLQYVKRNHRSLAAKPGLDAFITINSGAIAQVLKEHNSTVGEATKAEQTADELLGEAVRRKASDIHIFVRGHASASVSLRIMGEMVPSERTFDPVELDQAVKYLYGDQTGSSQSEKNGFEPGRGQSATIEERRREGKMVRFRYQDQAIEAKSDRYHVSLRTIDLDSDLYKRPLTEMGYNRDQVGLLDDALLNGVGGLMLVVGATGDGKTTTCAGLLHKYVSATGGRRQVITLEDPIEYVVDGVVHTQVNGEKGGWVKATADILRRDPDLIFQGEMRTPESASNTVQAALSGHKTLVTVHANSAIEALSRLNELGIDWRMLGQDGFIRAVVFQRLLPTVCPHCSKSMADLEEASPEELSRLGFTSGLLNRVRRVARSHMDNVRFRNHDGCKHCLAGIGGRTAAPEVLTLDPGMRKAIAQGALNEAHEQWIQQGAIGRDDHGLGGDGSVDQKVLGYSAFDSALDKMKDGLVCPRDVEEKIANLALKGVEADQQIGGIEVPMLLGAKEAEGPDNQFADDTQGWPV